MADTNANVQVLFRVVDGASKEVGRINNSLKQTAQTARETDKTMTGLQKTLQAIRGFRDLKKRTAELNKEWLGAQQRVKELARAIKDSGTATREQQTQFNQAVQTAQRLKREYTESRTSLEQYRRQLSAMGVNTSKLSGEMTRLKKSLDGVQTSASPNRLQAFNASLKEANVSMLALGASLAAVGAAIIGPFAAAIAKTQEFQQEMATVGAISGATGRDLQGLTDIALEMGRTTRFTAVQAAEGLRFMSMAGLEANQQIAALPAVLQLAQAGALDLGVAADISTNILTAYGKTAEELTGTVDVLVKGFTSSNTNLQELGDAFKFVGPVAKGAGVRFEELIATLGSLANAGLKGTLGGTALRRAITSLLSPTAQQSQLLKELSDRIGGVGLQLTDASGNFVGFVSLLEQLEAASITTEEAMQLFGQRAGPGMVALLTQGSESLAAMTAKMDAAGGTAARIATIMDDTFQGAMKRLQSAIDGLFLSIGNKFIPVLTKMINVLTTVVSGVTEFHEMLGPVAVVIDTLVIAVGLLAAALAAGGTAWFLVIGPLTQFVSVATAAGGVIPLLTASIGGLTKAFIALTAAVAKFLLTNPVGWVILLTGAIATAIVAYRNLIKTVDDQIAAQEDLIATLQEGTNIINDYESTIANLDEGSKRWIETNKQLRAELEKVAEEGGVLADNAQKAANSISNITGEIRDGGKAIEEFKDQALWLEFLEIAQKGDLLTDKLEEVGDSKSFVTLKAQAEGFGITMDEQQKKIVGALDNISAEASGIIERLEQMGDINLESTSEEVVKAAQSYGLLRQESNAVTEAVVFNFEKMQQQAREKVDKMAEAIKEGLSGAAPTTDLAKEFRAGLTEIQGEYDEFADEFKSNSELLGEDTIELYTKMFSGMTKASRDGFLKIFRVHKERTEALLKSSLERSEKEILIEKEKARFLVLVEKQIQQDLAKERANNLQERIAATETESARAVEAVRLRASQEKIAEEQAAQEILRINAEKYVRLKGYADQHVKDVEIAYGKESDEYEQAVRDQKAAADDLKDFRIKSYQEATDAIKRQLDDAINKEKQFNQQVKDIANRREDLQTSTEDKIREIRRRGFTEQAQEADKEQQAIEKLNAARAALAEGDERRAEALARQAETIGSSLKSEQLAINAVRGSAEVLDEVYERQETQARLAAEEQRQRADALRQSMEGVTSSVDKLVDKIIEVQETSEKPITLVPTIPPEALDDVTRQIQELAIGAEQEAITLQVNPDGGVEAIEQIRQTAQENPVDVPVNLDEEQFIADITGLTEEQAIAFQATLEAAGVKAEIKEIEETGEKKVVVQLDDGDARRAIEQLEQTTYSTHVVRIRREEEQNAGGIAGALRASDGVKLPGFGTKDTVPALLTLGERVLNATSTRILDSIYPGLMDRANRIKSQDAMKNLFARYNFSRFQTGGIVSQLQGVVNQFNQSGRAMRTINDQLKNMGRVELDVGGQRFPVMGQTEVIETLKRTITREKLQRSN